MPNIISKYSLTSFFFFFLSFLIWFINYSQDFNGVVLRLVFAFVGFGSGSNSGAAGGSGANSGTGSSSGSGVGIGILSFTGTILF